MEQLSPPIKRYLMGARPSHSGLKTLAENFQDMPQALLLAALTAGDYLSPEGKATRKAAEEGLVDTCEKRLLWNLEKVQEALATTGVKLQRRAVHQEVEVPLGVDPVWVNLGTLGTYFSVNSMQMGRWLDEMGLREDNEPTPDALQGGLATHVEMNAGGKKTRKITHWNLHLMKAKLVEAGHELDFDYEASLKGRGRNSDVAVSPLDERVRAFAKEFSTLFKNPATRGQCRALVQRTPQGIIVKAEGLLRKPGFITRKEYLKY